MLGIENKRFIKLIEKGVSLEALEKRLRPVDEHSRRFYLGEEESLLEVIHSDWEILERYGVPHRVIAARLKEVTQGFNLSTIREYSRNKIPRAVNDKVSFIPPVVIPLSMRECAWGDSHSTSTIGTLMLNGFSKEQQEMAEFVQQAALGKSEIVETYRKELGIGYINITELTPHLIKDHRFFGGRQSIFRTDPEFLIKAFNLT